LVGEQTNTEQLHSHFRIVWLEESWNRAAPKRDILSGCGMGRLAEINQTSRLMSLSQALKIWQGEKIRYGRIQFLYRILDK
jgi:hypothetical protein